MTKEERLKEAKTQLGHVLAHLIDDDPDPLYQTINTHSFKCIQKAIELIEGVEAADVIDEWQPVDLSPIQIICSKKIKTGSRK
jgi:cell division protein FtsX